MTDIDLDMPFQKAFPRCSVRLRNTFMRMGKMTLRDVAAIDADELQAQKNVGQTSVNEWRHMVALYGLTPGQVPDDPKHVAGGLARDKTLRDEFAGQAMRGMLASSADSDVGSMPVWPDDSTLESRAIPGAYKRLAVQEAYAWADAMIAERKREQPK